MEQKTTRKWFLENPYDIETLFEALTIASKEGKELIYMDRFIAHLRYDPSQDIANLSYNILRDLKLLKLEKTD